MKEKIVSALRQEFPQDMVDVSDGFRDNVHVIVVSRKFDNMREKEKEDFLWGAIDRIGLSEEEKVRISLVLPYSPDELK